MPCGTYHVSCVLCHLSTTYIILLCCAGFFFEKFINWDIKHSRPIKKLAHKIGSTKKLENYRLIL